MFAMRQIIEDPQDEIVLQMPPEVRHRRTEVIIRTMDDPAPQVDPRRIRLAALAGSWAGEPLVRAPQGEPEIRVGFDE
jgi:hypothetical protein